jgi:hypothetical protein
MTKGRLFLSICAVAAAASLTLAGNANARGGGGGHSFGSSSVGSSSHSFSSSPGHSSYQNRWHSNHSSGTRYDDWRRRGKYGSGHKTPPARIYPGGARGVPGTPGAYTGTAANKNPGGASSTSAGTTGAAGTGSMSAPGIVAAQPSKGTVLGGNLVTNKPIVQSPGPVLRNAQGERIPGRALGREKGQMLCNPTPSGGQVCTKIN